MDRWATKTRSEREDAEVERLVRPAPKVKPPRHDRRREQINPDRDPDIAGDPDIARDPDRSKNYKDVGGSAARVLLRFAEEKVTVRRKEDNKVVQVNESTLHENGAKYEEVSDEEKSKAESAGPEEGSDDKGELGHYLNDLAKDYLPLKRQLGDLLDADSFVGGIAAKDPETPSAKMFPEYRFPKGLETLGAVIEALNAAKGKPAKPKAKKPQAEEAPVPEEKPQAPSEKKPKAKKPKAPVPEVPEEKPQAPVENPPAEEKPQAPAPEEAPVEKPTQEKEAPQAEDVPPVAEPVKNPEPEEEISKEKKRVPQKGKGKKKPEPQEDEGEPEASVQAQLGLPEPKRREASIGERKEALLLIQDSFPPDMAAELIARRLHPDDVHQLISSFTKAKSHPIKNLAAFAEKAGASYESSMDRVKPPAVGLNAKGEEAPFESLSPVEKAAAYRTHQMKVMALSLAAKDMLTKELSAPSIMGKPRMPPQVASVLASFMLQGGDEKKADLLEGKMFSASIQGDKAEFTESQAKQYLKRLPPGVQRLAKAYMEGSDFQEAQKRFIGDGLGKFSERNTPKSIVNGLARAAKFFQERGKAYGADTNQAALTFKVSLLDQLRSMDSKKYAQVRTLLDVSEADQYDEAFSKWRKAYTAWATRQEAHDRKGGGYRDTPFSEAEPVEPKKPARYDMVRAKKTKGGEEDPWEEVSPKTKTASSVAERFISTCSGSSAMVRDPRVAVYHGIDPQDNYPGAYPGWKQPHQRDLGETDFKEILSSAQSWLKTPVLSESIEGIEKGQQLRAALDLSIYEGPYNGQIGAVLYEQLLSRLSGGAKTAREADSRVSSCPPTTRERTPMVAKASRQIRQFATRAASSNPELAFDMVEFADKLATQEQDEKKQSQQEDKGQSQSEQKSQEDKGQQGQDKKASDKYAQLRSSIIRTAASSDPATREALKPLLQLIKDQG